MHLKQAEKWRGGGGRAVVAVQTGKGIAMQINREEGRNIPGGCKSHRMHASAKDSVAQQRHAWFADSHDLC